MRYDENGNRISETDARGAVTTHVFDALNRKRRTNYPSLPEGSYHELWNYDLQGNLISHVDRNGIPEGFAYDAESRLLASNRDGTTLAVRELDAVGNTELLIDARGNSTRSKFDLANRVFEVTAANGDVVKTSYDVMDNVKTQTDGANRTSEIDYDFRNRKTEQRNALNEKTIHTYDGVGNLKTTKKPVGLWTYGYDAADRLETLTTPEQHVTTYGYDKNGNRLSVEKANGHETLMRNQLETLRYANGENESYRYDPNDNRIGRTDANGVIHTMEYDPWNRLTNQSAPTSIATQAAVSTMRYDATANLLSVVETLGDGSTKTELSQNDRRDRLEQKTDRNGRVIKFGYDAASNQTSYTDSDGVVTTREFDTKNRLIKTLRATLGAVILSYTGADELKTVTHPNGTETTRSYDQAGRLQTIEVKQGVVIVSSRHYTFDQNGNRKTQVEQNGGAAESSSYDYDDDNRLIKVIGPDQTETYTLDAAGNRKTEVITNLTNVITANKTYDYNNREQLTSVTDATSGVTTTYRYDGNGNQTEVKVGTAAPTLYTWGPRDQLASLNTGAAFEYDTAGHRTAKTASGNRTQYVWHGDELLAETNTLGSSLSQYTRAGTLLLGEVRGGVVQHFDQDAFNSVMLATNADGSVPGRASYRAYGKVRQLTGVLATPFRFNGYVDDGGDELSSPSRYYSLGTGRFTSMDPAKPDQMNPLSWNAYVGLNSNPMGFTDSTGRYAEGGHYYTSYYVALMHGKSAEEAQLFAFYTQLADEVDDLDAIGVKAQSVWADLAGGSIATLAPSVGWQISWNASQHANTIKDGGHSLTGNLGTLETEATLAAMTEASNRGDFGAAAFLGHRLGDTVAHRKMSGMEDMRRATEAETFDLFGLGHLFEGTTPDVIQRAPDDYLMHVRTLSLWMSRQDGKSSQEAEKLADQIVAKLSPIAHMPTEETIHEYSWVKEQLSLDFLGLSQGSGISSRTNYFSNEKLQVDTVSQIRALISANFPEANLTYMPEEYGSSFATLVFPFFGETTIEDAVTQYRLETGRRMRATDVERSIRAALKIIKKYEVVSPSVVVEGSNGSVLRYETFNER